MIPISISKFADLTVKNNPDTDKKELIESLKSALIVRMPEQFICAVANSIWATGSTPIIVTDSNKRD